MNVKLTFGSQSDDMPRRDSNLRVAPVKWQYMLYILYIKSRAMWWLVPVRQPVGWYICPSRLSPSRICQVACDKHTHTHTHVYYTTNRMPSVVYTCPIVPVRQPSDYMFETIIIQSYLSPSTRPMHETRVPYKIPPGALNKTYSQFIPAQSKDLSLTHYTL